MHLRQLWIATALAAALLAHGYSQALDPISALSDAEALKKVLELYNSAKYLEAIPLAVHLVKLRETAHNPDPTDLVTALNYLVLLYSSAGEFEKAEPLSERALQLCEKAFVGDHAITAQTLTVLGQVQYRRGNFAKAELVFTRAVDMAEKVYGAEAVWTATSLNNLALVLNDRGDYGRAQPLFERALTIYEKALGPDQPGTALALNNLALLSYRKDDYSKAKQLFERALTIYEKVLGPDHPNVAKTLNNVALLLQDMGDYEKAESLCQRSVDIYEKALGPDHPDTAVSLNNLALLYNRRGNHEKAKRLFERVVKIYEKAVGPENPYFALALGNLARVLAEMEDYEAAEPLFRRAAEIDEKSLGADHPQTAMVQNNLAILSSRKGDYKAAEVLFERSRKAFEKTLGADHSYTGLSLSNSALLCIDQNMTARAVELAPRVRVVEEKHLANILSFASEQQRLAFQKTTNPYTLAATLGIADELAETVLRQKGVVLDSLLEDHLVAEASRDPKQRAIIEQLRTTKGKLAQMLLELPKDLSEQGQKERMTEETRLLTDVEQFESELARQVTGLGKVRRALSVTVAQVRSALPKQAVLIELIRYRYYVGKGKYDPRYGAVLIAATEEPRWVPLGSAEKMEATIQLYRKSARGDTDGATLSAVLRALHDQVWAPLERSFAAGTTTVIVSPDAELNFVSLATLLTSEDRFVGEKYSLRYVASGRDLLRDTKPGAEQKTSLRIFANPDFATNGVTGRHAPDADTSALRSSKMRDLQALSLPNLPGTAKEARQLKKCAQKSGWQAQLNLGSTATEAELSKIKAPRVLHLATHGFFLPEIELGVQSDSFSRPADNIPKDKLVNPMHRSGLALTGAQRTLRAWGRGEVPSPGSDGIVTAEEVGSLNLNDTWLVVLSACDTGSGEAKAGEGVMGLRRGFVQAGGQNLLMTLWPISDDTTVQIMLDFYDAAFKSGNAPQALADTQRDWLVKLRRKQGLLPAVQLAGPFIMSSQGKP